MFSVLKNQFMLGIARVNTDESKSKLSNEHTKPNYNAVIFHIQILIFCIVRSRVHFHIGPA